MKKVRRKYVDWLKVLDDQKIPELYEYFYRLATTLHAGKHISLRRCAYCTLKHHYSTTTVDELVRKLGL